MKKILYITHLILLSQLAFSQVYTEKQTRHRFAQMHLGLDLETSFGGLTTFINEQTNLESLNLKRTILPRFMIGGTHFWGHADFYIAIPLLFPKQTEDNQEIQFLRGTETVFKYYPWRIERNKIRPFIGVSVAPFYFEQKNGNFDFGNGPELNHIGFPILAGITFNNRNNLFELGFAWNYANQQDYYISIDQQTPIQTPPVYMTLSYRYMFDTTLSAEKDWESGKTKETTKILANQRKLNGFFLGAGFSSAWWLGESSYNKTDRPFIEPYGISLMSDFTFGYYLHKQDLNINSAYRGYRTSTNSYGAIQSLRRKSILLETTKYVFDYHGFAPFIGPAISYEQLSFIESFENELTHNLTEKKLAYGLTFGWDIRPNRLQSWILRTNLRWYPMLSVEVEPNKEITFNNLEFNFIQLIIYPNRMFRK